MPTFCSPAGLVALQLELIALRVTSLGGRVALSVGLGLAVAAFMVNYLGKGGSGAQGDGKTQDVQAPPAVTEVLVTEHSKGQVLQVRNGSGSP